MKVEGTPYETMLAGGGYHVMRLTQRYIVPGAAPVVLSVAGPFPTRDEAANRARELAKERV